MISLSLFTQGHFGALPRIAVDPRAPRPPDRNGAIGLTPGMEMRRRVWPEPHAVKGMHLVEKTRIVVGPRRASDPVVSIKSSRCRRNFHLPDRPVEQYEVRSDWPDSRLDPLCSGLSAQQARQQIYARSFEGGGAKLYDLPMTRAAMSVS